MVLRGLIIQADLLLSGKQLPEVSDLVTGFVRVDAARSSIMPANGHTDPCHSER
jgi:hypothetical protein